MTHFDALGPGLAQILFVRDLAGGDWVLRHHIKEAFVPVCVDKACALRLQLMAHSAGAKDHHVQIFVVAVDGASDGFAKLGNTDFLWVAGIAQH